MAFVVLGASEETKTSHPSQEDKMDLKEIQNTINNMDRKTKERYMVFLVDCVKKEKEIVLKASREYSKINSSTVVGKNVHVSEESITLAFDNIIKILNSDFADMYGYQIEELKKERKILVKDLTIAYFKDFK